VRVANVEIADISEELKYEDRFVWVGLFEPDEKLLREIQEEFCLHDLAIAHQRPKRRGRQACEATRPSVYRTRGRELSAERGIQVLV
jgi:hypothetical protein